MPCKCPNCLNYGTKGPAMMEASLTVKDARIAELQAQLHAMTSERNQYRILAIKAAGGLA